jgi:hypothetical protein
MFKYGAMILLISRSYRQAAELFRTLVEMHRRLKSPMLVRRNAQQLELSNGSRVVCLPCREDTVRCFSGVTLLVIDEAARVPDSLYRAVRPMLAASPGRKMICLSTPYGKRGFFWDAWAKGGDDWHRIQVTAAQIPRIPQTFLDGELRAMGESYFRQEYFCSFESVVGLVHPKFARCLVSELPPAIAAARQREGPGVGGLRKVGGIDFGYRNPFAAIWGFLDKESDVLWITNEHYYREQPLSYHAAHLPRNVHWYCDPSGATERSELRLAGLTIAPGKNSLRPGIAAVNGRIESGRLFVLEPACPKLILESGLYRYSTEELEKHAETPEDEHNHALSALRYLITMLDNRHLARSARGPDRPPAEQPPPPEPGWGPARDKWCNVRNEELWTIL